MSDRITLTFQTFWLRLLQQGKVMAAIKEYKEQMLLMQWCDLHGYLPVHCPNGEIRTEKRAWLLKQMGLRPGFPDLTLFKRTDKYGALHLEMKQNRYYRESEKKTEHWQRQQWWIDHLTDQGYYAAFAYGWEHGARIIQDYLAGKL